MTTRNDAKYAALSATYGGSLADITDAIVKDVYLRAV